MFGWLKGFRRKFAEKHSVGYWHHSVRAKYPIRIAWDLSVFISKDRQLTKHEWHKLDKDLKRIWKSYTYLSQESTYEALKDISGPDYTTRPYTRKLSRFHTHLCADRAYPVRFGVFRRFDSVYAKIIKLYHKHSGETWLPGSKQRILVEKMYANIHAGVMDAIAYYTNKTVPMAEVIKLPRTKRQQKRAA